MAKKFETNQEFASRVKTMTIEALNNPGNLKDRRRLYQLIYAGDVKSFMDSLKLDKLEVEEEAEKIITGAAFVTRRVHAYVQDLDLDALVLKKHYDVLIGFDSPSPHSNAVIYRWKGKFGEVFDILKRVQLHLNWKLSWWSDSEHILPQAIKDIFPPLCKAVDDLLNPTPPKCGNIIVNKKVKRGVVSYFVCSHSGHTSMDCLSKFPKESGSIVNVKQEHQGDMEPSVAEPTNEGQLNDEKNMRDMISSQAIEIEKLKKEIVQLGKQNSAKDATISDLANKLASIKKVLVSMGADPQMRAHLQSTKDHVTGVMDSVTALNTCVLQNYERIVETTKDMDLHRQIPIPAPQQGQSSPSTSTAVARIASGRLSSDSTETVALVPKKTTIRQNHPLSPFSPKAQGKSAETPPRPSSSTIGSRRSQRIPDVEIISTDDNKKRRVATRDHSIDVTGYHREDGIVKKNRPGSVGASGSRQSSKKK